MRFNISSVSPSDPSPGVFIKMAIDLLAKGGRSWVVDQVDERSTMSDGSAVRRFSFYQSHRIV